MSSWTTERVLDATPDEIMAVLVDPQACSHWSPIRFTVDELDGDRLVTGSRARVGGRLGAVSLVFEIEVLHADERRLRLTAHGPMVLDVEYEAVPNFRGTHLSATVEVHGARGIRGRLVAASTEALLRAGALSRAISRIANEVRARHPGRAPVRRRRLPRRRRKGAIFS